MRLRKLAIFIALLSPLLLAPAYAQRTGARGGAAGRAGGAVRGGVARGGYRGGYYRGRGYYYGGRYWGPGIYFGWGYPYWGYPYYWPYWNYPYYYPYYWDYPYYGYNPYYYGYPPPYPGNSPAAPPPATQQPQPQGQPVPPQDPPDPQPVRGSGIGPWELSALLNDPDVRQQFGITAAQAAKIQQQESAFRKAEIRNRADLQIKRMDLDDLLFAEKPDRSAIDSKLQEIGAAQIGLEKSAIDNFLTLLDVLTPAQRQQLQGMMPLRRQVPRPAQTR